jgi:membrane protease YdiL (CAAX protease family)
MEDQADDPALRQAMLAMQGIVTFIGLICFPLMHITLVEQKPLKPFFPPQENLLKFLLIVACLGVAFPVSISPIAEWNMNLQFPEFMSGFERWAREEEETLARLTEMITNFASLSDMLIGIFVIALLPAIGEELVFRGLIQNELWRATSNPHTAIWLSSAIFSAIHFQFFGFVPRLLLGALFGYLYYWSGNLFIPIFSHFFNNAFIVIVVYLNHINVTPIDLEDGEAAPLIFVVGGAVITIGLLYHVWNEHRILQKMNRNNSISGDGPLA